MQKSLIILIGTLSYCFTIAQQPVRWSYSSKKLSETLYEVHITANIDEGWHIYAQKQPKEAIAAPTKIKFNGNPLLKAVGKTSEIGTIKIQMLESLGIEQYEYSGSVDFVQVITLKNKSVKINLTGSVAYQACTDEKCLLPKEEKFNMSL